MWDHCPSNLSSPRSVRGAETDLALRLSTIVLTFCPVGWCLLAVKLNISKLMIMWCEIIQVVELIFPDFLQEFHTKPSDKMGQIVF